MSAGETSNFPRGRTWATIPDNMLGRVVGFPYKTRNTTYSGVHDTPGTPAGAVSFARLVKNDTGNAIARNLGVVYDTTSGDLLWSVGAKAGTGTKVNGYVDAYLPAAGVPTGEYFWLFFKGPHTVTSDGNATIACGDKVMAYGSATGKVRGATGDTMAAITSIVGQAMTAATNVDGTEFECNLELNG